MHNRKAKLAAYLIPFLAGVLSGGCERQASDEKPVARKHPNIVFLMVDTLRADRLGAYGHAGGLTPMMDRLAAEGVLFERAISAAPWTLPSVASLFSSRYPTAHKFHGHETMSRIREGKEKEVTAFAQGFSTLAEVLRDGGYATAAIVANPIMDHQEGLSNGFNHYDSSFARADAPGSEVNHLAVQWLAKRDPSKPFFLYLHYIDVHAPYEPGPSYTKPLIDAVDKLKDKRELSAEEIKKIPSDFGERPENELDPGRMQRLRSYAEYWRARYEGEVRRTDDFLSDLRARLMGMGLWEDAYVILTADHGEALFEHGFWAHGYSQHHTDLHVPLVLRWPGELDASKRIPQTARLIDIMPTLIDQLGLPGPEGMQGESLVPLIAGKPGSAPAYAFAESIMSGPEQKAVYQGDLKLMLGIEPPMRKLFDLKADPGELHDLAGRHPDQADALAKLLDGQSAANAELAKKVLVKKTQITPEQLKNLETLGYISNLPKGQAAHATSNGTETPPNP